jgi:hypothetical protein
MFFFFFFSFFSPQVTAFRSQQLRRESQESLRLAAIYRERARKARALESAKRQEGSKGELGAITKQTYIKFFIQ